jgi:putative oxidoreductase
MNKQVIDTHELITPSPPIFAGTDQFAIRIGDAFALVGRILLGWLFFIVGWAHISTLEGFAKYLTSLGVPGASFWATIAMIIELAVGLSLILGVATRYGALLGLVFVVVATALAHRYWEYPAAQQMTQYNSFLRNLSIVGGLLLLYVTGAGRFSVDGWLRKRG